MNDPKIHVLAQQRSKAPSHLSPNRLQKPILPHLLKVSSHVWFVGKTTVILSAQNSLPCQFRSANPKLKTQEFVSTASELATKSLIVQVPKLALHATRNTIPYSTTKLTPEPNKLVPPQAPKPKYRNLPHPKLTLPP